MSQNTHGMEMIGQIKQRHRKKIKELGLTILEALVSTVIVSIGFLAIFQMVNYSVVSIDTSGERTKSNYLVSMVAEDLIGDKDAKKDGKKTHLHLLANKDANNKSSWRMGTCSTGATTSSIHTNALDNKKQKWDNRFSKKRIKCKGDKDIKALKIFDICRSGCTYANTKVYEKMFFGRMEVNLNNGKKRKYIYFLIDNKE